MGFGVRVRVRLGWGLGLGLGLEDDAFLLDRLLARPVVYL